MHQHGAKMGIQLAHAGRKASAEKPWGGGSKISPEQENGWQTLAPSAIPFGEGEPLPAELSGDDIRGIVSDFRSAAERALQAGYDLIEVHAAHGYLLHEFYSPLSNRRSDHYGGSFENRIRLTLEVVEAVQQVWGKERPLIVRISATDWVEGGWTLDDSLKLAARLKEAGVHLIDTSSGGNALADIPVGPGYQVSFASEIRKRVQIPVSAVGLITTPRQAEDILQRGDADLIMIARESLRNPDFPLYAAHVLGDEDSTRWPEQYARAYPAHGEWKLSLIHI